MVLCILLRFCLFGRDDGKRGEFVKQVFGARLEVQGKLSNSQKSSIAESSKMKSAREGGKLKGRIVDSAHAEGERRTDVELRKGVYGRVLVKGWSCFRYGGGLFVRKTAEQKQRWNNRGRMKIDHFSLFLIPILERWC